MDPTVLKRLLAALEARRVSYVVFGAMTGLMPIRKFRSVEEMSQPMWHEPGDPALARAMAVIWEFGQHTRSLRPVGVTKFQSFEELCQANDRTEAEHVRALRERRQTT
jgi:hypothetical protein